jgi:hypothetical protein
MTATDHGLAFLVNPVQFSPTFSTGDRCYDFLNISAKKIGGKIGVFDS